MTCSLRVRNQGQIISFHLATSYMKLDPLERKEVHLAHSSRG